MDQELIAYLDERFRETAQQIQGAREEAAQRFDQLSQSVDQLGERVERVEQSVEQLGERVERVEQSVDQLGERVERVEQRVDQLSQRVEQTEQRVEQVADTVLETQVLVEDLRGKIELVAEGVVGVNERLDTAMGEAKQEFREVRSLLTVHNKSLDGRIQVVEDRTVRHTREIAALRRRSVKPRLRPS